MPHLIRSLTLVLCIAGSLGMSAEEESVFLFPKANSRATYFSIHNIAAAHEVSRGRGAKIGILDHSFAFEKHRDLYAGGRTFQTDRWAETFESRAHHGFWMSNTAREIAPEAEIYALGVSSSDESRKVEAMVNAIDWAIEQKLDAITYSAQRFSPEGRKLLDDAVGRAVENGVVVAFIHYPHPGNLLPSGLFARSGDDEREPDVNILHYDYSVLFAERYRAVQQGTDSRGYRPFLSMSSTSPVTAGIVALMRSANPKLTPAECKEILMRTARPLEFEGQRAPRVVDAAAAVKEVMELK
jgi:hypothetical protein